MNRRQKLILMGLAGLSGLLLALAHPGWSFDIGFLVWIGFIPLLYALTKPAREHDRAVMQDCGKKSFFIGFFAGLIYFLIIFRWFWSIHPLDTLGIQSKIASLVIVFIVYAISCAGMAVFWGLFGMIYGCWLRLARPVPESNPISNFKNIIPELEISLLSAALFVLLEYARAYGFSLLWLGSGTLLGPHWTLGNLAYALAGNNLALRLSSYVGIYGISFVVMFVNSLLLSILKLRSNKSYLKTGIVIIVVLALALTPKLFKPTNLNSNKKINFAVIQINQPTKILPTPKETLNAFKEQLSLLKQVAVEHPESQLIIFPEASDFFKNLSLFLTGPQVPNYFSNLFKEPRLIISGARVIDVDGHAYSRVFALDTQKDIIGFYDKRLLTPGGEFLPYPVKLIVNLLSKIKVSKFGELRELEVGKEKVSTVNYRDQFSAASVVCSEILSPGLVQEITQGSDIIIEMASYGIFHGNATLIRQNLAGAKFRAAENQKPLIAAVNMGLSYAINSNGSVAKIAPNQAPQILTGGLALNPQKSWYNKIGDTSILVGCLVLAAYSALFSITKRKLDIRDFAIN